MSKKASGVVILTAGIGLGVYIPSLLIQRQLATMQIAADVEVLERYYMPDKQRAHLAHKAAFQENFNLALIANRMARPVEDCLDKNRIQKLLGDWAIEDREDFVVWSGYWLPTLEKYRNIMGKNLNIDLCHIDAEISASFRAHPDLNVHGTDIWLWNWAEKKIVREIPVSTVSFPPVPFSERANRLIVHGGGWGLGTYRSILPELEHTPYALDIVVHKPSEIKQHRASDRYLMTDPKWEPWQRDSTNQHSFPGVGEVLDASEMRYTVNSAFHEMHNIIRQRKAIVSKPGGCTLIDSLNSATPLVILDPFGRAEASNAALWEYLGYGVSLLSWRKSGYSESLLWELHSNITNRASTGPGYPQELAQRLR